MSTQYKDERKCMICGEPVSASKLPQHIAAEHADDATGGRA